MPTYEYECTKCGAVVEMFQGITDRPKRKLDCAVCGRRMPVRRLIGAGGGIVFKGSGFYATDYRSDHYKKAADADKPATKSKDDATGSSADASPKTDKSKTTPEPPASSPAPPKKSRGE